jgi:hypothetical protein
VYGDIEVDAEATCNDDESYWQPFFTQYGIIHDKQLEEVEPLLSWLQGPIGSSNGGRYHQEWIIRRRSYDIIMPYISPQIPRVVDQFVIWDTLLPCDVSQPYEPSPLGYDDRPHLYLFNSRTLEKGLRDK